MLRPGQLNDFEAHVGGVAIEEEVVRLSVVHAVSVKIAIAVTFREKTNKYRIVHERRVGRRQLRCAFRSVVPWHVTPIVSEHTNAFHQLRSTRPQVIMGQSITARLQWNLPPSLYVQRMPHCDHQCSCGLLDDYLYYLWRPQT